MKNYTITVLVLLLSASFGFAQKTDNNQQKLFTEFPHSVEISKNILADLFKATEGQTVAVPFNEKFVFRGKVMSNQVKYANLQTMLLRYEQGSETLFQLSKIINKDNSVIFKGRIINPSAMEVFELKNDLADNYHLEKINLDQILQDCTY
jgi:hypothetical protein